MELLKECLDSFIDCVAMHQSEIDALESAVDEHRIEAKEAIIAYDQKQAETIARLVKLEESVKALQSRVGECVDSEDDWWDWFRGKLHGDRE